MDKVFIHLAKRSGMTDREDFIRKIDLHGATLDSAMKNELIDFFRPQDLFLTYGEFVVGIR